MGERNRKIATTITNMHIKYFLTTNEKKRESGEQYAYMVFIMQGRSEGSDITEEDW